ncbi:GNAT family N-acetyltransferase [Gallaecimonas sp. GXIMD4217]|uniref:GNAT family N-acetyltransferase n=1 Tax=Gallaecimonas sp. GXIMD4217 TaxID=3131927 RepID=UPI00311B202D
MCYRLETERLILRPFTLDDLPAFLAMNQDPEVIRYTGQQPLRDLDQAREMMIKAPLRDYEVHGYGRLAVELKETGQVIGFCGIKHVDELGLPELGYRLLRAYWGKGLMTEGAAVVLEHGHTELDLKHIIALIHPDNEGSIRVAEKLGMSCGPLLELDGMPVWQYQSRR